MNGTAWGYVTTSGFVSSDRGTYIVGYNASLNIYIRDLEVQLGRIARHKFVHGREPYSYTVLDRCNLHHKGTISVEAEEEVERRTRV